MNNKIKKILQIAISSLVAVFLVYFVVKAWTGPSVAPPNGNPILTTTGMVMAYGGSTAPTGWFEANGAAVSRTTYAALYAIIGTSFGNGDGSTTFNLPDLRGEFIRGWNHGSTHDPDVGSRIATTTGAATGDNIGSWQADQFRSHTHSYNSASGSGAFFSQGSAVIALTGLTTGAAGGSETRPQNVYLMYIIKY